MAGITISGGLFYVGGHLGSDAGHVENCLVNPALRVGPGMDREGVTMPYWPRYSEIRPDARHAYLTWLASDRSSAEFGIGHVFLYFYGLERRLFVERKDAPTIIAEVRRLLEIFGVNGSFRRYATQLLDFAAVFEPDFGSKPEISLALKSGFDLPLRMRAYLGAKLSRDAPLDADDALIWFLASPETSLRTPGYRCFDEFRALWQLRFAERYPKGLRITAPKTRLKDLTYTSASGTFRKSVQIAGGQLPDIVALSAPLSRLGAVAEAICTELDPFSRLVGKRPEARRTAAGAALLPSAMLSTTLDSALKKVKEAIDPYLAERKSAFMRLPRLLDLLGFEKPTNDKIPTATFTQLTAVLDKLGVGFEPDRRYGSGPLSSDGLMVLFRAENGGPVDPKSSTFKAARTMVDVSALAAAADGTVTESEVSTLTHEIQSMQGLGALERLRLMAHAAVALRDAPGQQSTLKKLSTVPEVERRRVGNITVAAILADGRISPEEVKFFEKLWRALDLPEDEVYVALHRGGIASEEPVSIMPAMPSIGMPIPRIAAAKSATIIAFDQVKLKKIVSETREVSELLAGVFARDEGIASQPRPVAEQRQSVFEGLDRDHSALLLNMLTAGRLSREAFEAKARELRLLPDGALDTLNEWGFDTFDESILEGEDEIVLVKHLIDDITATKRAA